MTEMVIRVFNMSFAAGCTACLVILLRRLSRRLPKGYGYWLWLAVLFRFLCPVVIHGPVSLLPVNPEPVRQEIVYQRNPEIRTGVIWVDRAVNGSVMESLAPETAAQSVNPIQVLLALAGLVWVMGMAVFFLYHLVQYVFLIKRLSTAVRAPEYEQMAAEIAAGHGKRRGASDRQVIIRQSDQIESAFVLGLFRPVIYVPNGMEEAAVSMILSHELVHVRRKDGLMKLLWLAAVMIHWFNPLSWISFRLMCADMEMSCDEQALQGCGMEERKVYSMVLLAEAGRRSRVILPLAFGKNSAYQRIRNILTFRRPKAAVMAFGGILLAAAGISLIVSPKTEQPEGGNAEEGSIAVSRDEDTASVSIIGGADGPTSIFLAGKLGGGEEPDAAQQPEAEWLASVRLGWRGTDDQTGTAEASRAHNIELDLATEESLVFHGDFGLFAFQRSQDGYWKQSLFLSAGEGMDVLTEALAELGADGTEMSQDSIHREERFIQGFRSGIFTEAGAGGDLTEWSMLDYGAAKMADGRIAVLGASPVESGECRLIDLWYGYYDPEEQVMTQVSLFLGDGTEWENPAGNVGECRYLFSRDDYDYFLRTPRSLLEFEQGEGNEPDSFHRPYDRLELVRSRGLTGGRWAERPEGHEGEEEKAAEEVLDPLACMQSMEHQKVVLTEERIVYTAAADADNFSFKNPGLVSIRLDGRDRRAAEIPYQVYNGLSYDEGWLYYEGWTNDGAFPRPLCRMKPDFSQQEKLGDLTGSLLTVRDGGVCWQMDWEQMRILVSHIGGLQEPYQFLSDGEQGRHDRCQMEKINDSILKIEVIPAEQEEGGTETMPEAYRDREKQIFYVRIPALYAE